MINRLLGKWRLDSSDVSSVEMFGDVSLEFNEHGELIYTIHLDDKDQTIFMTYEIEGNYLITDQPSHPDKQTTDFQLSVDGKLELYFEGRKSIYLKM
jgi:hypothetical protein